jgi:hypothetical protein
MVHLALLKDKDPFMARDRLRNASLTVQVSFLLGSRQGLGLSIGNWDDRGKGQVG